MINDIEIEEGGAYDGVTITNNVNAEVDRTEVVVALLVPSTCDCATGTKMLELGVSAATPIEGTVKMPRAVLLLVRSVLNLLAWFSAGTSRPGFPLSEALDVSGCVFRDRRRMEEFDDNEGGIEHGDCEEGDCSNEKPTLYSPCWKSVSDNGLIVWFNWDCTYQLDFRSASSCSVNDFARPALCWCWGSSCSPLVSSGLRLSC